MEMGKSKVLPIAIIFSALIEHIANDLQPNIDRECNGILFDHVYHKRDTIKTGLGKPTNLVLHHETDLLFFSHTVTNETQVDFKVMCCHIVKKECDEIPGVPGGYAVAHDIGNDDIYFGGEDGIYRYNFLTKSAEYFAEEGVSIWELFIRRKFYYIRYPTQTLHVYQNDIFVPVIEASDFEVDHFFMSRGNTVYFSNGTALFKTEAFDEQVVLLNGSIAVRQITDDVEGEVYFCASDGIYREAKHHLERLAYVGNAYGLAFDGDNNMVISDDNGIYRLTLDDKNYRCQYSRGVW